VPEHGAVQPVLVRLQLPVEVVEARADQPQRLLQVARVQLDQRQAVVVEDGVEGPLRGIGEQLRERDGDVDPGPCLRAVAPVRRAVSAISLATWDRTSGLIP